MPYNTWFKKLVLNSRFWILSSGVVLSINIAGFVQLLVPPGSAQTVRIEELYGLSALTLLYIALLASPLTQAYPNLPFAKNYLHARRAIGVLSFYYACLHVYLTFFDQLGGFSGIQYYNQRYVAAVLSGVFTLLILLVLTATSLDWVIRTVGFRRWKMLQRLVYIASLTLMLHIILLGSNYRGIGFVSTLTMVALGCLLLLETQRFWQTLTRKRATRA